MTKRAWGASIQNREEKFESKRRAVLVSAARIIRHSSFEKLSLADVAVDLNVAKPTVYYYFRNKEEIVRELMEMAVSAFFDADEHSEDYPSGDNLNGAQLFERFVRRCVRVTSDDVGACLFMVYPNQLDLEVRRQIAAIGQPVVEMAERILRQGMSDGSIVPNDPSTVYNFVINGLRAVPILLETSKRPLEQISNSIVGMILRGVETGA